MGQKANPVSLRLKTTNKNFDSCWYSDLHYSSLLSLELRARSYIEKVFEQIRYPRPLISLSLIPKRGKILMFYLNPERLRGQRNERFQLKSFMPPRNVESHARHLPTRSTEAAHVLGLDGSVGTLRTLLAKGSALHVEPRSSSWKPEINQVQINRPWERAPASYKQGGWMQNWERRLFIYSTLLSITKRRSNTVSLFFKKDFALFHRIQGLVWFQGREESCLSSTNRRLLIHDKQAGGALTRAYRSKGRGIPFSRPRGSLANHWGAGAPNSLTRDSMGWGSNPAASGQRRGDHQVGKPSSRGSSIGRGSLGWGSWGVWGGSWGGSAPPHPPTAPPRPTTRALQAMQGQRGGSHTTQTPLARELHTWCARGLPLISISGLTAILPLPPGAPARLPHQGSNLIKRNRDIVYWVNIDTGAIRSVYTTTSFSGPTETAREVEARSSTGHSSPDPSKKRDWVLLGDPTDNPLVGRRAFISEIGVKSKRLDGYLWPKPSIREIRREEVDSSVHFMEIALGRGLGVSTTIYPYKSIEEEQTAQFLSEEIAYYLERRIPFRRIKQALIRELQKKYIEGIKVSCSGRVGGRSKKAQRSREESFQWGQTSSHVFSSKLSFASRSALTPFGKVGIKVWICYKKRL